ncbi:MAG: hypothetical protein EOP56_07120 [Sphingobacteriales bacterium]|nr:MAG: hypothetical protein EOP56_07120 [Sphingobacteriales bacterium]
MRSFRCFLLSVLFVVLCQGVSAQRPPKFEPRTRNFEMDKVYPVSGESKYNRLRVLDVRVSKEKLGYLKTGAFNRNADLVTEQPFDKLLTDYYTKMLAELKAVGNEELVMVLHDIIVEDRAAGQEIATMFLDADFFGSRGDRYYYLGTADTLYEMSSNGDVSGKLLSGTVHKIADILSRFSVMQGEEGNMAYTAAELEGKRAADNRQYEAYKVAGQMKPGVYYTAEQFLNNTPVDTPIVIRENTSTASGSYITVYYPKSKTNKKARPASAQDIFAVCDGTMLVCGHKRGFSKMTYEHGDFLAVQYFPGITSNSGMLMGGAMFGLVGAAIVYAAESAANKNNNANVAYYSRLVPGEKRFIPTKRAR